MILTKSLRTTSLAVLGLFTAGSAVLMSCNKEMVQPMPQAGASTELAAAPRYSGEELFQGIFMMDGRVAESIPYFANLRSVLSKSDHQQPQRVLQRHQLAVRLTAAVRQLDPHYLTELQTAVAAQNINKIEVAVRKGAALQRAALLFLSSSRQADYTRSRPQDILKKLNLASYDFHKQADFERFMADTKAIEEAEPGVASELEGIVIYGGIVLDYCLLYPVYNFDYVYHIYGSSSLRNGGQQVTQVMQKQADLEKEQFIRDLALLTASRS